MSLACSNDIGNHYKYERSGRTTNLAWNRTDGLGLEGEDRLAACALGVVLSSSSSSEIPRSLEFFL
jgi:hypothetical protein